MLIGPSEEGVGFRGRHLRLLNGITMMKNRKQTEQQWSQEQQALGPDALQPASSPESLPPDAPLLTTYPHASVLRLRVVQIVCGISAMVMGTVGFIEERGRLNLGLGIPAGAATVLAAAVSIHLSRSFSGPGRGGLGGGGGGGSGCCATWCGGGGGGAWRLRRVGPLAACWVSACLLHTALIVAAVTAFVAQFRISAEERNRDILVVSMVQLGLSLGTLAAEAALVAVECRRWPLKAD